MNSSCTIKRPTRYGARKMAAMALAENITMSPSSSSGCSSGFSHEGRFRGATWVCSAIAGVVLRDRRVSEVLCRLRGVEFPRLASWLEIDARALVWNAGVFRQVLGGDVRLGGVRKGNAYGHGFAQALPAAHASCDVVYVIDPRDALAVREYEKAAGLPQRQVLVLGAVAAEE